MTSKKLAAHLQVDRYGSFQLTDAVRPALELPVIPCEGFRVDLYHDPRAHLRVPVLAASVSRERLFDVFLSLLEPLQEIVDVVLETSHDQGSTATAIFFANTSTGRYWRAIFASSKTC